MSALRSHIGCRRTQAAILISLMGEAEAASILRNLPGGDLERVAEEIANLPPVPAELTLPGS